MSRRDRPEDFFAEPERSASKRRRAPDADSIFEVLDAPLPSEVEGRTTPAPERTRPSRSPRATPSPRLQQEPLAQEPPVAPRPMRRQAPRPETERRVKAAERRRVRRVPIRKVKRTLKTIDPISVLKVSFLFYAVFLVIWLVFVAIVYVFLDGLGLFDQLESLGRDLVLPALEDRVTLGTVERWAFFLGVAFVIGGSIVNAILAILYNVISRITGGIEMTFNEKDPQAPPDS